MKELDEVRRARTVTMQDDEVRSEVAKIVENQLCQDIPNQISTDIDTETHDPDDDVSNQISTGKNTHDGPDDNATSQITIDKDTKVTHDHDDENHRLRSDQVNLKAKELAMLAMELEKDITEEQETTEEAIEHQDTNEQLQERLRELTELADCGSLDIAMAIAAEGMLNLEGLEETQVSATENDKSG